MNKKLFGLLGALFIGAVPFAPMAQAQVACAITTPQAAAFTQLIRSAPNLDQQIFVTFMTGFSNGCITTSQASAFTGLVRSSPHVDQKVFVDFLVSFTRDATTNPTPTVTTATFAPTAVTDSTIAPQLKLTAHSKDARISTAANPLTPGDTAILIWNVPSTSTANMSCISVAGNIYPGVIITPVNSWRTPPLYTTTQYGIKCTNNNNMLSTTQYATVYVQNQITVAPIAPKTITLLSPNTGRNWYPGTSETVMWSSTEIPGSAEVLVRLRSVSTGQEYNLVFVSNNGSASVTVPTNVSLGAYYVEVKTSVGGQSYLDSSDHYIEVVEPSITLTHPNEGNYWYRNQSAQINWQTTGIPSSSQILIRLRSVSTNQEYNLVTVSNSGVTTITVTNSIPYDAYYVEVKTSVGGQSYMDSSDLYIKIVEL